MPGPIYTAGRTPLTSDIVTAGGLLGGPPPSTYPQQLKQQILAGLTAGPDAMSYIREILSAEASAANASVTTGSGTVAGDLILVFHSNDYNDAVNVTPPTTGTWTLQATGDNGTLSSHVKVWSGSAAGGAQTITVQPTINGEEHSLIVVVFNSGSYTVDGAAGNNGAASASQVAPSVTTSGTTDILFTCPTTLGAVGGNYTPPANTTRRAQTNDPSFAFTTALGTEMLSSAGATGTRTWTFSASIGAWASVSIAVNVGAGGPATVNGAASLSGQSTLTVAGSVSVLAPAALTFQSNQNTAALVTALGASGLSAQLNASIAGTITQFGASV
jgi:hypothetical protein